MAARHTAHYTQAQIQAILHAHLIEDLAGTHIAQLAAQGKLGQLPAFRLDRHYVYTLIRKHRDAFEDENPHVLAKRTHLAINKAHRANLAHLEALANDTDPGERARITKAVAETAKALQTTEPRQRAKATRETTRENATEPVNTRETPNVVADLIGLVPKATRQGARTGSLTDARTGPDAA